MPVFTIQTPDGRKVKIEAADQATAILGAQEYARANPSKARRDAERRGERLDARDGRGNQDAGRVAMQGYTFGLGDELQGLKAGAQTGLKNLIGRGPGYTAREAYDATRGYEDERVKQYRKASPGKAVGAEIAGAIANPVNFVGGEIIGAARGGQRLVRGAAIGGATGAAYGAGSAPPGRRGQGAVAGAVTGAATGAVAPVIVDKAGGAARTIVRGANKATGGRLLNPEQEAMQRLAAALRKDRLSPDQITKAMNEWQRVGGPSPTFLDLVGENTKALVRGAASKGEGRAAAVKYGNQVAADLQDNAIARTRQMTPDKRTTSAVAEDLTNKRRVQADIDYPAFAPERVPVTGEVQSAVSGRTGETWLQNARNLAEAERRPEVVAELDALASGQVQDVSAGALDYVRRGMRDASGEAYNGGRGELGHALKGRSQDLETALDPVPGFNTARTNYANSSRAIEGLEVGKTGMRAQPDEFAAALQDPFTASTAPIGYREALETAIGAPAEGSTGVLNRISTATNQRRNLGSAFGEQAGADYQASIGNMVDQLNNARFINPNTGSQTAGRLFDEGLVEMPTLSKTGLITALFRKLQAGATLTDGEREAIVRLSTSDAASVPVGQLNLNPRLSNRTVLPLTSLLPQQPEN